MPARWSEASSHADYVDEEREHSGRLHRRGTEGAEERLESR